VTRYAGVAGVAERIGALAARGAIVSHAGRSRDGRAVLSVTIGRGGRTSAILAGVHPIEWIGVEVGLALLERLCADPPRDRRVIAFPLVNVDGYARVDDDLRAGRRRWHRHNRAGVDLNRNFPVHWRARGRLASGVNWGGARPADQPEVAAVVRTLGGAGVDRAVSLHSIGNKILLPYAGRFRRPAQWRALHDAARAIQQRMPPGYSVTQASRWLPGAFAYGLELDWLHGDLGALTVLVECTLGGARWSQPSTWLDPFAWYNPADPGAHADAIAQALEPFVRGA
jgi:hypothetical protein